MVIPQFIMMESTWLYHVIPKKQLHPEALKGVESSAKAPIVDFNVKRPIPLLEAVKWRDTWVTWVRYGTLW